MAPVLGEVGSCLAGPFLPPPALCSSVLRSCCPHRCATWQAVRSASTQGLQSCGFGLGALVMSAVPPSHRPGGS